MQSKEVKLLYGKNGINLNIQDDNCLELKRRGLLSAPENARDSIMRRFFVGRHIARALRVELGHGG